MYAAKLLKDRIHMHLQIEFKLFCNIEIGILVVQKSTPYLRVHTTKK